MDRAMQCAVDVASPSRGYGYVNFMVSRYFAGSTWGGATAAFELYSVDLYSHRLVMGKDGTAWLVWVGDFPKKFTQESFLRSRAGDRLQDVYLCAADDYNDDASVAVNEQGNLVVAWHHSSRDANGVYQSFIWANTRGSSGWGQASAVNDPGLYSAGSAEVALDEANHAMVVWTQTPERGALPAVWCNQFTVGSTPGPASPVATGSPGTYMMSSHLGANQGFAQIAMVEHRWCPTNNNILLSSLLTKRFTPGVGWGATEVMYEGDELLSVQDSSPGGPGVALDNDGNAILTWVLYQPEDDSLPPNPNPSVRRLLASYYRVGSGWGNPVRLSAPRTTPVTHR